MSSKKDKDPFDDDVKPTPKKSDIPPIYCIGLPVVYFKEADYPIAATITHDHGGGVVDLVLHRRDANVERRISIAYQSGKQVIDVWRMLPIFE
jgi:hypothetical protein